LKASVGSSFARHGRAGSLVLAALVASACAVALLNGGSAANAGDSLDSPGGGLHATIRTTSHGIPHILASNFAGLGYGYGYVAAKANICVLADTYVTANAERSRWFGPDASYT
jgi:acyl-homoserine-lactone acylase